MKLMWKLILTKLISSSAHNTGFLEQNHTTNTTTRTNNRYQVSVCPTHLYSTLSSPWDTVMLLLPRLQDKTKGKMEDHIPKKQKPKSRKLVNLIIPQ